jgi:DnaJ-class molecular chaperone
MAKEIQHLQDKAQAHDVKVTVNCTLYEFYNGAMKQIDYDRVKYIDGTAEPVNMV